MTQTHLLSAVVLLLALVWVASGVAKAQSPDRQEYKAPQANNASVVEKPQTDQTGGNSNIQGWTGQVGSFVKPAPSAKSPKPAKLETPDSGDSANVQAGQVEGNPNFQGWDSDKNAYRNVTAEDMSALRNNLRRSPGEEGEDHPGSHGFVPPLKMLHGPAGQ